ncbi:MAG: hypothetical protein ABFS86_18945 [Planctomycetota bacterium]
MTTVDERMDDFERWLSIGLGRAIRWVDAHGDAEHREFLSRTCLVETAYDHQVEGSRAGYIHELLTRTPDPAFYRDLVLGAVRAVEGNGCDDEFLLKMAWQFTDGENDEFREVLYEKANSDLDAWELALQQIVVLDGIPGLLKVARERSSTGPYRGWWPVEDLIGFRDGRDGAEERLAKARRDCPELDVMLAEGPDEEPATRAEIEPGMPWPEIRSLLSVPESLQPYQMRFWARGADEAELTLAAEELIACPEDDPRRIRRLIQAFSDVSFPGPLDRILSWARGIRPYPESAGRPESPEFLAHSAAKALARTVGPEVRAFGLELVERGLRLDVAAECLRRNFEDGDWEILADLARRKLDPDETHWLTKAIDSAFTDCEEPDPEAVPALLACYERNPCSFCREMIVRDLDAADAVPDWMREECRDDACDELRDWAESGEWKD